jgi:guanylate kinase
MNNLAGKLFIISGPSGTGKSSLTQKIIQNNANIKLSISATTRSIRSDEIDGREYYFVSIEEFQKMIAEDLLLEYAIIYNNYYGTIREHVLSTISNGCDMIVDVDWYGAQQIIQQIPHQSVTIFIMPPSLQELERRLITRNTDDITIITERLNEAAQEISYAQNYQHVVTNDNFESAYQQLLSIIQNARMKSGV